MIVLGLLSNYWWILLIILSIVFFNGIMRLFGIINVPEDKVGLVNKKFRFWGGALALSEGRLFAINGEAGYQAQTLTPGFHFWLYPWKFDVKLVPLTNIPSGCIGLVYAEDGKAITVGSILGRYVECQDFTDAAAFLQNGGQKGRQATYIPAGSYRINTNLFKIVAKEITRINENMVGVITTLDGEPLPSGEIAGKEVPNHNNFQDIESFLNNGGQRGIQSQIVQSGTYNFNPWFVSFKEVPLTEVPIGSVGVIISFVGDKGEDLTGEKFGHGNIVANGKKGVWNVPFDPGKYAINPATQRMEVVPTTNIVLNWANNRNESHKLDENLSTITVRSKDGFAFNLDVSQIIHVPSTEASKVIARFGNMKNLVSQVLEPTIGNYFRNSAQNSDVIAFLVDRKERQTESKMHISSVLKEYNVTAVDTLIGDIVPPADLMKTLTDRKIAEETNKTYSTQIITQQTRQDLEKQKSIADIQGELVKADQGVVIAEKIAAQKVKEAEGEKKSNILKAEGDKASNVLKAEGNAQSITLQAVAEAERTTKTGTAEANVIELKGNATAKAYEEQAKAIGQDAFGKLKMIDAIAAGKLELMPKILITGGQGGSSIDSLAAIQMLNYINPVNNSITPVATPKSDKKA
jgi:uncharacterized membrane protein YqiK